MRVFSHFVPWVNSAGEVRAVIASYLGVNAAAASRRVLWRKGEGLKPWAGVKVREGEATEECSESLREAAGDGVGTPVGHWAGVERCKSFSHLIRWSASPDPHGWVCLSVCLSVSV